jgi:hypothetical protein
MATVATIHERRPLAISRVLSAAFGLIRNYPFRVFGLGLLVGAVPERLTHYLFAMLGLGADEPVTTRTATSIVEMVTSLAIGAVVAGMLAGTVLAVAEGSEPSFAAGIRPAFRKLGALLVAALLYAIGCLIGMIALLIPFIFLWVRWSVVAPVVVLEPFGSSAAFGRSSALTEGARGRIFGLLLLIGVVTVLIAMVLLSLLVLLTRDFQEGDWSSLNPVSVAIWLTARSVTYGISAAVQCALYIALRERAEGPLDHRLSQIFE